MSNRRVSVSQIKQLIQLRSNQLSTRDIARAGKPSRRVRSPSIAARCLSHAAHGRRRWRLRNRSWSGGVFAQCRLRPTPTIVGPGLRVDPHGDEAPQARNAAAVVGGISRDARPRGAAVTALFASATGNGRSGLQRSMRQRHIGGRETLRRLRGTHGADLRRCLRGRAFQASLFVGALGASGYCVCGGDAHGEFAGLDR